MSVVPTEFKNGRVHCQGLDTEENALIKKELLPLPYLQHVMHVAII